uniref:FYVE-type domain-containing protein n=1 Tax=Anopheles epiroticus TaxID=199890 RepID=A0A182P563_9DIPT
MACTICTRSFGFFNKEHGCPVCKFSFCSGCLKYKLVRDGKKLNVCLRCSKLAAIEDSSKLQAQDGPRYQEPTSSKVTAEPVRQIPKDPPPESEKSEDDVIRSKLEALKATDLGDQLPVTEEEDSSKAGVDNVDIEKRLAALKGVEYKEYKDASQRFMAPDNRTEEKKVQDLLGQFLEETKLINVMEGKRLEQDEEIANRLKALKEFPTGGGPVHASSKAPTLPDSDSDEGLTDEELARKLAQRYAEEGKLEAKLHPESDDEDDGTKTATSNDVEEQLPWCTICNEDAALRCRGCDNDLYCRACYKEFHYDEDPQEHRTVPFKGGKA